MDGYKKEMKVADLWVSKGCGIYRLVDNGAGPLELQVQYGDEWKRERECYIHAILCDRIVSLANVERERDEPKRNSLLSANGSRNRI